MKKLIDQWNDLIPPKIQKLYHYYDTTAKMGKNPVLVVVDVYNCAYDGGPVPPEDLPKDNHSGCGFYAYDAIKPTQELIALCREKNIPIVWLTKNWERYASGVVSSRREFRQETPEELKRKYEIYPEFDVQPHDTMVTKNKSSGFFETNLKDVLDSYNCDTMITAGISTSGCVRATVVDGWNHGFYPILVEETLFEANPISRAVNLWDIHHKYGPVVGLEDFKQLLGSNSVDNRLV